MRDDTRYINHVMSLHSRYFFSFSEKYHLGRSAIYSAEMETSSNDVGEPKEY